jgi:hypothetical protein
MTNFEQVNDFRSRWDQLCREYAPVAERFIQRPSASAAPERGYEPSEGVYR